MEPALAGPEAALEAVEAFYDNAAKHWMATVAHSMPDTRDKSRDPYSRILISSG